MLYWKYMKPHLFVSGNQNNGFYYDWTYMLQYYFSYVSSG